MSEWLASNWEYILLGFMVLEKVVKLSPSKKMISYLIVSLNQCSICSHLKNSGLFYLYRNP